MCKIAEKLGVKVAGILLVAGCMLAGLNPTRTYGQPLDSPLYEHTRTEAFSSMSNAPAGGTSGSPANPQEDTSLYWSCCAKTSCQVVPVMPADWQIVWSLVLIGGGCWGILRGKRR
jgi:hypothetical protein